jgi:TPR repeat protein
LRLKHIMRACGMMGCLMLACGCVKTVKGHYYNLQADHYYYGDQKQQAFDMYHKSAENGVADAQYQVAQMLLYCDGVPGSTAEGMQWLEKAAAQGHVEAARDLGLYLLDGEFDSQRDTGRALSLLERAGSDGDTLSMLTLGYLYLCGYGAPRNPEKAAYWYGQAADYGESIPVVWKDAVYLAGLKTPPAFDPKLERRERIKRAQTGLKALGYYKSTIDGIVGPGTAGAVKRFQQDQKIDVTGKIDVALMRHLYRRIVFDPMNRRMM